MISQTVYTVQDVCRILGIEEARFRYYEALFSPLDKASQSLAYRQSIDQQYFDRMTRIHTLFQQGHMPHHVYRIISEEQQHTRTNGACVIAIASGKGGVGKTSLTANVSIALAMLGNKVLCIDGDLGLGNVHILYGMNPVSTLDQGVRKIKPISDIIEKGPQGVDLIASSQGVFALANVQQEQMIALVHSLHTLTEQYDFILIDCAAGISHDVYEWSSFAQQLIVVVTPLIVSLADSYSFIKVLTQDIKSNEKKPVNIVVNACADAAEAQFVYGKLNNSCQLFLKRSLRFAGYIRRDSAVETAIQKRVPLMRDNPESNAAFGYRKVAECITSWHAGLPAERQSREPAHEEAQVMLSPEERLVNCYIRV